MKFRFGFQGIMTPACSNKVEASGPGDSWATVPCSKLLFQRCILVKSRNIWIKNRKTIWLIITVLTGYLFFCTCSGTSVQPSHVGTIGGYPNKTGKGYNNKVSSKQYWPSRNSPDIAASSIYGWWGCHNRQSEFKTKLCHFKAVQYLCNSGRRRCVYNIVIYR